MSSVHPHWEATDTEKSSVDLPVNKVSVTGGAEVSRRPAAIVGMLLVTIVGYLFFWGVDNLTSQLGGQVTQSGNEITVRITPTGVEPVVVQVSPGQTLRFRNEQDTPHIIESAALCSDTGFCLRTDTLFNGDSDTYTITQDIPTGTYNFSSATDSSLIGQIMVTNTTANQFTDIRDIIEDSIAGNSIFNQVNTTTQAPPAGLQAAAPGVPTNPYSVDSNRQHPFDSDGNPIASVFGDDDILPDPPRQETQVLVQQVDSPQPALSQPTTGSGSTAIAVAIFTSLMLLWWFVRQAGVVQS